MFRRLFLKYYVMRKICLVLMLLMMTDLLLAADSLRLESSVLRLVWGRSDEGWKLGRVQVFVGRHWVDGGMSSGKTVLLYGREKPSDAGEARFRTRVGTDWPDTVYKYQINQWKQAVSPVSLNEWGEAVSFFPGEGRMERGTILFMQETAVAVVRTEWSIDPAYPSDVRVRSVLTPKVAGCFSLATPSLLRVPERELAWATVPGYFSARSISPDFVGAYAYGHGVPGKPVIYRERCASTECPIVESVRGFSLAVIPDPGQGRDPWAKDRNTHQEWMIGLSHMSRDGDLSPTLYYPVAGEPGSMLSPGQSVEFSFRYSLRAGGWFGVLTHAVEDVYHFRDSLALRHNRESLTDRMKGMRQYLTDTATAMWHVEEFQGLKIGAQSYLGGVVGSQHDAMKNSDYGAMWMVASETGSPWFRDSILPYARNFKLVQQQTDTGFFQGAAIGQYYLARRKKFVEEWGEFVEPVSLTYYTMLDLGNILLFSPKDTVLRSRLRLGAETLLRWQRGDGSWAVAYDRHSHQALFTDIDDLRPTFYGLLVAYRVLHDTRYLTAAKRGADWLIRHGVDSGRFIGVCGDARYAPDFATGQTAQCLLDLYDLTKDVRYRAAAIASARLYTESIYTQPVASSGLRVVAGRERSAWEIAQSGLSFEHGGILGSANGAGPIVLCSHAGMFVRMFGLTGDSLFLDMARAAAIGRDAFVDSATHVASYYWNAMNKGAGPYPHHAWWQIGWITDYLLSEAMVRSHGRIDFPRGFVTPKVGPHSSYGFAPGWVNGWPARLIVRDGLVHVDHPDVEVITALSTDGRKLFLLFLNDLREPVTAQVRVDLGEFGGAVGQWPVRLDGYGLSIKTITINQ